MSILELVSGRIKGRIFIVGFLILRFSFPYNDSSAIASITSLKAYNLFNCIYIYIFYMLKMKKTSGFFQKDALITLLAYTEQEDGSYTRPLGEFPKEVV